MNTSSKYFDKIRIGKRGARKPAAANGPAARGGHVCQWDGCEAPATHRAPMGRAHEGQYFHFCFDHVREYNKTYNYFSGLDDEAVAKFQKEAVVGHRPTWTMGVNRLGNASEADSTDRTAGASARIRATAVRDAGCVRRLSVAAAALRRSIRRPAVTTAARRGRYHRAPP